MKGCAVELLGRTILLNCGVYWVAQGMLVV